MALGLRAGLNFLVNNVFGGLLANTGLLLEDSASFILLEDNASALLLE